MPSKEVACEVAVERNQDAVGQPPSSSLLFFFTGPHIELKNLEVHLTSTEPNVKHSTVLHR